MSGAAAAVAEPAKLDLIAAYDTYVDGLGVGRQRWARRRSARRFLRTHPDLREWMRRPTPARLADLHRAAAWPFVSWCFLEGHLRPDLELLLAKPGGVELPSVWAARHRAEATPLAETGRVLGWSAN